MSEKRKHNILNYLSYYLSFDIFKLSAAQRRNFIYMGLIGGRKKITRLSSIIYLFLFLFFKWDIKTIDFSTLFEYSKTSVTINCNFYISR